MAGEDGAYPQSQHDVPLDGNRLGRLDLFNRHNADSSVWRDFDGTRRTSGISRADCSSYV
jgi:hypothetical protein